MQKCREARKGCHNRLKWWHENFVCPFGCVGVAIVALLVVCIWAFGTIVNGFNTLCDSNATYSNMIYELCADVWCIFLISACLVVIAYVLIAVGGIIFGIGWLFAEVTVLLEQLCCCCEQPAESAPLLP